jgi:hypothetical protein
VCRGYQRVLQWVVMGMYEVRGDDSVEDSGVR